MGGKPRKPRKTQPALPTSPARERFLKRRRAAVRRITSRSGKLLNTKWAKQFVDAGYKYVFVEIPVKGKMRSARFSMPGQPNTGSPFHLSPRTPEADIIFGNDLDDLKWFDSKLQNTSSFTGAQRTTYPALNENGGVIIWGKKNPPINLADGKPVNLDRVALKPRGGHVGFDVDHSAVASGQMNLNSMLEKRRGNLHPPASDLALEDSRMLTEKRARYRADKSRAPGGGKPSGDRGVSNRRGIDDVQPKPRRPSGAVRVPSTSPPGTSVKHPPRDLAPRVKPSTPDIDVPIKKSPRIRIPKGLILDIIVDFIIGTIISDYEQQIAELTQNRIKSVWADKVYKLVQPQIESAVALENYARKEIKVEKAYIEVDWEVLLREQAEEFSDAVVWFFKFSHGKPGFVELFEDINYISHRPITRSAGWHPKPVKPRRFRDNVDKTLIHEQHRQYILVWDKKIHLFAKLFRKLVDEALVQLDLIVEKINKVKDTLSKQAQKNIDKQLLRGDIEKIANALYEHNFKEAKRQSRFLIMSVRGQFNSNKVPSHRVRRVVEEIERLQFIMREWGTVNEYVKSLNEGEKGLLSMFLGQKLENLR